MAWGSSRPTVFGGKPSRPVTKTVKSVKPVSVKPVVKGPGKVSSYDNAWHPTSWYAPKPVMKPVSKKVTTTGDKGSGRLITGRLPNGKKSNVKSYFGTPISRNTGSYNSGIKGTPKVAVKPAQVVAKIAPRVTTVAAPRVTATAAVAPKPVVAAAPKPVAKPPVKPVAKVVPKPATANKVTRKGGGKMAKFSRRRGGKLGPRGNLSMTPEMLQAAARQRIVNYH